MLPTKPMTMPTYRGQPQYLIVCYYSRIFMRIKHNITKQQSHGESLFLYSSDLED